MATRVPLKLKDSADFQDFSSTEENYLAYQVGQYLISGDSSDVGSLTMDSSGGTQAISGTFTDTAYDSAVGTGGSPGSFLTFSQTNTILRTNLGTITPADSDYRIPVFREHDSDRGTITVGRPSSIPAGAAGYATISNVSGDSLTIKIPSSRNKVFDTFCASSINIADSAVNGTAVAGGNISLGNALHEPPKLLAPIVRGVTTGRYEDSDNAYVFNVENVTIGGTAYSSAEAKQEYEAGDDYIYVDNVDQDIYQSKIKEYNDSDMNVLIDRLNGRIATSDYLGSYRLGSSAPSGDYTVNLANVMTDTRTDGSSTAYNIYQRTTQSAPTQVLPFAIKRSNGDSGDYQGLQLMTDRQIQQGLGLRARNRLGTTGDDAGTVVGNYKLLSSAAGTPTDLGFTGTWAARGTATDTRQAIVDANYSRNRVSTYSRLRESTFSDNYSRTRSSNYSDNYSRVRSSAYSDTYTVNRQSNYSVGFVGDYSRNFTRLRSSNYTRTRQSTFNYTRARASTFTGNYSRVVNYEGNFIGNYTRTSTVSETDPLSALPSQGFASDDSIWTYRTESETAIARAQVYGGMGGPSYVNFEIYVDGVQVVSGGGQGDPEQQSHSTSSSGTFYSTTGQEFSFSSGDSFKLTSINSATAPGYIYYRVKLAGTQTNNYTGNYTRTSTRNSTNSVSYSRTRASTFTGNYSRILNYLGNYTNNFLGEYARDFTRTTPDVFTRDFTGNYSRDFSRTRSSAYTRDSQASYAGNYTGNFQGDYAGNFIGNFIGPRDGTAGNETDTTVYNNTLQVLGSQTFDIPYSSSSRTYETTITVPNGTKGIAVLGGITSTSDAWITSVTVTETDDYSTPSASESETSLTRLDRVFYSDLGSYSSSSAIYMGDVYSSVYGSDGGGFERLTVTFGDAFGGSNGYPNNGAGVRVIYLNKTPKSAAWGQSSLNGLFETREQAGYQSSNPPSIMTATTNPNGTNGTTQHFNGGLVLGTATISGYNNGLAAADIGSYVAGGVSSYPDATNTIKTTDGLGNTDHVHGYKLPTVNQTNITPAARNARSNDGETLLEISLHSDFFYDNIQDYLRQSTRTSLRTSSRTSTRTGTSRDASGESPNNFTGDFSGNFTGNYARTTLAMNYAGFSGSGQTITWDTPDEDGYIELASNIPIARDGFYQLFGGTSMTLAGNGGGYTPDNVTRSKGYKSELVIKTSSAVILPTGMTIQFQWTDSEATKSMNVTVPYSYQGNNATTIHTFNIDNGLQLGQYPLAFSADAGTATNAIVTVEFPAGDYAGNFTRTSTRNSTRTSQTFTGNYSRNFSGQYSGEFTRDRTSTYLGSDTFSRTFTGNYVGNYSRDFTRTFTGNYSRNFVGNYQGDYANNYLGDYSRTFIGNYAGNSIGSGNTNIETYTLYVRTS